MPITTHQKTWRSGRRGWRRRVVGVEVVVKFGKSEGKRSLDFGFEVKLKQVDGGGSGKRFVQRV